VLSWPEPWQQDALEMNNINTLKLAKEKKMIEWIMKENVDQLTDTSMGTWLGSAGSWP
jgi:hypothetical protein